MTTPADNTLNPTDRKDLFEHADAEKVDTSTASPNLTYDPNAVVVNEDEDFVEGGLRAWLVVIGSSIFAALVIGWPFSWGVFQAYYFEHNTFPGASETTLSWLGSVQGGLLPTVSFFSGKFGDRYGYKPFVIAGSISSCLGLLFTAFSTTLW
ncbi:hypothetical protein FRB94_011222 [Tulasnella sp. JGI-2019a]|nr:hypothetical protein FRB94_011222 [Tulasnella sp. JGI-2019a]